MDKKEFVIRQLFRIRNKKYEHFVVSRIWHNLNDIEIKFVTQQYVSIAKGYAMTDVFFPQFNLHVEVDEVHHLTRIPEDKIRENDIIDTTGHLIKRIDSSKSLDNILLQSDKVVDLIINLKREQQNNKIFEPWDLQKEFSPLTYINKGYISLDDKVAFRTIADACNCFGNNFKGYQRAIASHPNKNTVLWFPKLYSNNKWINSITKDQKTIITKPSNLKKREQYYLDEVNAQVTNRIVFARVKGELGDVMYRFKGLYQIDKECSSSEGVHWRRISSEVKTYKYGH